MRLIQLFLLLLVIAAIAPAQVTNSAAAKLKVYFVDVEGGQATLFLTPAGQSLLIDTGWPGHADRDALRIAAAAKDAGLRRIDYVLITHFHDDHVGGVAQLVAHIPVGTFIDHGANRELDHGVTERGMPRISRCLPPASTSILWSGPAICCRSRVCALPSSARMATCWRARCREAESRIRSAKVPPSSPRIRRKTPARLAWR